MAYVIQHNRTDEYIKSSSHGDMIYVFNYKHDAEKYIRNTFDRTYAPAYDIKKVTVPVSFVSLALLRGGIDESNSD